MRPGHRNRLVENLSSRLSVFLAITLIGIAQHVRANDALYELPPINYSNAPVNDAISKLQRRLLSGKTKLQFENGHGYLKSLLSELNILQSSQSLVFSKTSFQREAISPESPRALYFDDDTYIGWVQRGDVLEVATTDPDIGPVFYTLEQREVDRPKFVRQTDNCLQCHAGSMTRETPGLLLRSVFTDPRGQPILSAGTFVTTQESEFKERFGGWYITGKHGAQRHMGNLLGQDRDNPEPINPDAGANLTDLSARFDTSAYLTAHSDLVTLMVFSHQAELHNLLTRANYGARLALHESDVINESLHLPQRELSEGCIRRIRSPADALVKYMLFCGEAALTGELQGTSTFASDFAARGPRDSKGRSLRDFDLTRRLFKYPCSYLIYSEAFDGLPAQTEARVYQRLWEVLSGADASEDFAHLTADDRKAILEIIRETKPALPDYWKEQRGAS